MIGENKFFVVCFVNLLLSIRAHQTVRVSQSRYAILDYYFVAFRASVASLYRAFFLLHHSLPIFFFSPIRSTVHSLIKKYIFSLQPPQCSLVGYKIILFFLRVWGCECVLWRVEKKKIECVRECILCVCLCKGICAKISLAFETHFPCTRARLIMVTKFYFQFYQLSLRQSFYSFTCLRTSFSILFLATILFYSFAALPGAFWGWWLVYSSCKDLFSIVTPFYLHHFSVRFLRLSPTQYYFEINGF